MMLRSPWSPPALMLVLLMAVGSVVMWIGVPLGLIYVASQRRGLLESERRPVPARAHRPADRDGDRRQGASAMLDRVHGRLTGRHEERHRATWLRSMRAERISTRRAGVLDQVMIVSVALALVAFGVWFFAFAGSSLPTYAERGTGRRPRRARALEIAAAGRRPSRGAESPACT